MTLDAWLTSALSGLDSGVRARLGAEYRAHVQDALEAGETEAQAVVALGDPSRLNVQLQRDYLTVQEAAWTDKAAATFVRPVWIWLLLGAVVVLTAIQGDRWPQMWGFWVVTVLVLLVRWAALRWLTQRPAALLLLAIVLPLQLMGLSGPLQTSSDALATWAGNGLIAVAVIWLIALLPRRRIWRKVWLHG
ncbi:HAAS signaling domain-containing protein [Deinococcus sp. UYEF24]